MVAITYHMGWDSFSNRYYLVIDDQNPMVTSCIEALYNHAARDIFGSVVSQLGFAPGANVGSNAASMIAIQRLNDNWIASYSLDGGFELIKRIDQLPCGYRCTHAFQDGFGPFLIAS